MVKILQGRANETHRDACIASNQSSARKQRLINKSVRMSYYLAQPTKPSIGAKKDCISLHGAHSSSIGTLV